MFLTSRRRPHICLLVEMVRVENKGKLVDKTFLLPPVIFSIWCKQGVFACYSGILAIIVTIVGDQI